VRTLRLFFCRLFDYRLDEQFCGGRSPLAIDSWKLWNRTVLPMRRWRAVSYCFFTGATGSTAATPSGLMLKARNTNGSLPGLPHW